MNVFPVWITAGISLLLSSSLPAQERASKGKGQPMSLQGEQLPDVSGFDEAGDPFPLVQKLKGKHGVIVFGCLT